MPGARIVRQARRCVVANGANFFASVKRLHSARGGAVARCRHRRWRIVKSPPRAVDEAMDFEIPADIQPTLDATRRVHRARDQAAGAARTTTSGSSTTAARCARTDFENGGVPRARVGGAARRDAPPRRRGRLAALRAARRSTAGTTRANLEMAIIREHLAHEGARAAQRPAERELDRRQLPDRADDARLRHRRAARRVDAGLPRRHPPARVRADRAEPRLRRHLPRDHRACATATSG